MAARAALEASSVTRDVVLYEHDRSRFFRLLGLFCTGQGFFWAYLAHSAFTGLRPAPGPGPDDPLRPRDNKWRFGFTASCLTAGTGAAGTGWPLGVPSVLAVPIGVPAVPRLSNPGRGLSLSLLTVPLRDVSGRAHRAEVAAAVPIKVRGRPFFFLLDKRGRLRHPRLFDVTAGALRRF
ncbi:TM223 protein, partial [Paradoxornis webbianus]|nr:TM223 protein [Sinosuthora webbiana]